MKTSEEIKNIIKNGSDLVCAEASKCGYKFELVEDSGGVLDDDDECLSLEISIRCAPFQTDDGEIKPKPVTFELRYDRHVDEFLMIAGEDSEFQISYGNVMAYMYFNSIQ